MIYTCTLNPSVDYHIETENLSLGMLNRIEHTAFYPGGKGINVSRVLHNLGMSSVALGFIGGFTGDFIEESIKKIGIRTNFVKQEQPTRINVKIKTANEETEVNDQGASIAEQHQAALLQKLEQLTKKDYLVISGSLPASVSFSIYEKMARRCSEKGVSLIVDIPHQALKDLLIYEPLLVKPNQAELSEIVGMDIHNKEDAVKGAKKLVQLGAQNVIVSMGKDGAVFVNEQIILSGETPRGTLKSSVGAGDSLVAGFLASFVQKGNVKHAFQQGVAAGSATAYSDDLCHKQEVFDLFTKVKISHLKGE
ncbi:1-phosphofructokinase [Pseudogracilibacillus auburnensis]|uniref:Tagatose-6-phosphate kinase n=1 Tax=Pseudogracilibacillus auburnensis TaxID=1494959 RepID=A0A2V3VLE9_9BACI|nr:1-phosphofructokinase [Pseudogracilibacillus auburnensis]MBO1002742.1 1-phosphofructokinase [Pseudogracilibacillus auburnensis]PXW81711.1 fructose-1-phosphate kinase [Pseudogracilibacillus auburnensis]